MMTQASSAPKRNYTNTSVNQQDSDYHLMLDGTAAKSPAGYLLSHQHGALMQAIAKEWDGQDKHIRYDHMPLTQLLFTCLDMTEAAHQGLKQELLAYAGNDLLCYHAPMGSELATEQGQHWGAWLIWAKTQFGYEWKVTHDLAPLHQEPALLEAVQRTIADDAIESLCALYQLTRLLGSFILGHAMLSGACSIDEAMRLAWLEQEIQVRKWGEDVETTNEKQRIRERLERTMEFYDLAS